MFKSSAVANNLLMHDVTKLQDNPGYDIESRVYRWKYTPKDLKEKTGVVGYLHPIEETKLRRKTTNEDLSLVLINETEATVKVFPRLSVSLDRTLTKSSLINGALPSVDRN